MPDPDPSPREYDLKPDPVEEVPPLAEPKLQPLNYRRPRYDDLGPQGPGRAIEFTVGFFTYFGVVTTIYFVLVGNLISGIPVGMLAAIPILALGVCAIYLQGFRGWRGFVPGVLLGFGLSCLIGVGGVIWIVATCRGM